MAKDLPKLVSEESLKHFGGKVDELIKGRSLTRGEASDLFRQILNDEQPDLQQGAFLAAITAKGATAEEIAGIWEAIYEVDTLKVRPCVQGPLADNCGTGMDSIKTFNISTAASIVAAADNINMAKHGSRAITSSCGTVDMLEMLGIDVDCDVDLVKRSIEVAGIGIFNGMSGKVHPSALSRILSQIRFGTVLNIAGSLANPALPAYGVRGVYSREMVLPIAKAMREIGYKRAFVVHGRSGDDLRGMDELSTLGRTDVAELDEDGRIREYALNACDLGLEKGDESALLNRGNIEEEAVRLLQVLSGLDRGDRKDIVCLNAAPLLCITGRSEDLREGVEKASDIIDSGRAIKKLIVWVREQNKDPGERLERLVGMLELAYS